MKITANEPSTPSEVKLILSTEEAYALMAAVGKVNGPAEMDGKRTVRGYCSDIYNGLRGLGFAINHSSCKSLAGELRYKV